MMLEIICINILKFKRISEKISTTTHTKLNENTVKYSTLLSSLTAEWISSSSLKAKWNCEEKLCYRNDWPYIKLRALFR